MFGSWWHLIFNLLVQLVVGLPLEMVHGSCRVLTVYMAGVLAGSLGTSVCDAGRQVYLVGASGGVYALLAAHIANVLLVSGRGGEIVDRDFTATCLFIKRFELPCAKRYDGFSYY